MKQHDLSAVLTRRERILLNPITWILAFLGLLVAALCTSCSSVPPPEVTVPATVGVVTGLMALIDSLVASGAMSPEQAAKAHALVAGVGSSVTALTQIVASIADVIAAAKAQAAEAKQAAVAATETAVTPGARDAMVAGVSVTLSQLLNNYVRGPRATPDERAARIAKRAAKP